MSALDQYLKQKGKAVVADPSPPKPAKPRATFDQILEIPAAPEPPRAPLREELTPTWQHQDTLEYLPKNCFLCQRREDCVASHYYTIRKRELKEILHQSHSWYDICQAYLPIEYWQHDPALFQKFLDDMRINPDIVQHEIVSAKIHEVHLEILNKKRVYRLILDIPYAPTWNRRVEGIWWSPLFTLAANWIIRATITYKRPKYKKATGISFDHLTVLVEDPTAPSKTLPVWSPTPVTPSVSKPPRIRVDNQDSPLF